MAHAAQSGNVDPNLYPTSSAGKLDTAETRGQTQGHKWAHLATCGDKTLGLIGDIPFPIIHQTVALIQLGIATCEAMSALGTRLFTERDDLADLLAHNAVVGLSRGLIGLIPIIGAIALLIIDFALKDDDNPFRRRFA